MLKRSLLVASFTVFMLVCAHPAEADPVISVGACGGQFLTLFIPGVIDDNSSGLISLIAGAYLDLPPGPSGDGTLASVEFSRLGAGNSPINVQHASLFQEGSLSPEPEPHTLPLLISVLALAGAGQWGRRRTPG